MLIYYCCRDLENHKHVRSKDGCSCDLYKTTNPNDKEFLRLKDNFIKNCESGSNMCYGIEWVEQIKKQGDTVIIYEIPVLCYHDGLPYWEYVESCNGFNVREKTKVLNTLEEVIEYNKSIKEGNRFKLIDKL